MSMVVLVCLLAPRAPAQEELADAKIPILDAKVASTLLLDPTQPAYPPLARVNFIQGMVRAELLVSREGTVEKAHVLSGNPILAAAVLDSVRNWHYRSYVEDGRPIAFATLVDVNFALHMGAVELTPQQAESDFRRQVKPPVVLTKPDAAAERDSPVRVRLLVSAEGKVIDWAILNGLPSQVKRAVNAVERWSFRPARWGSLAVPWYVDVDVPAHNTPPALDTTSSAGRG
jgi:outer membrane biosynthesis protein TonB